MMKLWALSILRYCLYSAFRLSLDCKYFGQLLFGETGTIKDKLMVRQMDLRVPKKGHNLSPSGRAEMSRGGLGWLRK